MIPLRGKLALITGGSRGIGLAIAKAFAAQGASTILVARDPSRLNAAVAAVQAVVSDHDFDQPPAKDADIDKVVPFHTGAAGDVAHSETWIDLSRKLRSGELGQQRRRGRDGEEVVLLPNAVDVLVNCAGIAQYSLLARTPPETIASILDTNLRSAVLGCRYMSRLMSQQRVKRNSFSSSIINVSSGMALMGGQGAAAYAASKAGLLGLTSALALELAPQKIRVNALVPGYIETDMTDCLNPARLSESIPLKRLGKAEEVAHAAIFLAQNEYANNSILSLDGGLSAGYVRNADIKAAGDKQDAPGLSDG